ncbi:Ferroxidase Hephl1 [Manis pentadactyla]|nr:Ferroxidase Hephl1 [Manis pentadactyla]
MAPQSSWQRDEVRGAAGTPHARRAKRQNIHCRSAVREQLPEHPYGAPALESGSYQVVEHFHKEVISRNRAVSAAWQEGWDVALKISEDVVQILTPRLLLGSLQTSLLSASVPAVTSGRCHVGDKDEGGMASEYREIDNHPDDYT